MLLLLKDLIPFWELFLPESMEIVVPQVVTNLHEEMNLRLQGFDISALLQ